MDDIKIDLQTFYTGRFGLSGSREAISCSRVACREPTAVSIAPPKEVCLLHNIQPFNIVETVGEYGVLIEGEVTTV
jgi:hypothetical protein